MSTSVFIEPLDVLFLRGNKLFGDPGSYGEALILPWPSVAAGAIRSRMLADDGVDLAAFARGEVPHATLGTPAAPGAFAVTAFHLARRHADGRIEALVALPADLVVSEDDSGKPSVRALTPTALPQGAVLASSAPLPLVPVLAERERGKPASGYWLNEAGWRAYLAGQVPAPTQLLQSAHLWTLDHRVGVGLSAETRRAADGHLFSVQAVAMRADVGFVAAITGATPPTAGLVRLGGDGRAAALHPAMAALPKADFAAIAAARRCRLVLTTPGVFAAGWLPTGVVREGEGYRFDLHGVRGRLVCAAVPRAEVVSGWDLARWQTKPAQRAAPTGSVYWLDGLEATPEALGKLVETGLWGDPCEDAARRAEGFNRIALAAY